MIKSHNSSDLQQLIILLKFISLFLWFSQIFLLQIAFSFLFILYYFYLLCFLDNMKTFINVFLVISLSSLEYCIPIIF